MSAFSCIRICSAVLGIALAPIARSAHAQFVGDVFFAQPSIAVAEGESGELELLAFVGTQTLGAIHVEVRFDAQRLDFLQALPGRNAELDPPVVETLPTGIGVIALNAASKTQPIGTVSIVRLVVRPTGPPGTRVALALDVRERLDTSGRAITERRGFSAEVIVIARSTPVLPMTQQAPQLATGDLAQRALAMRRAGAVVEMMLPEKTDGQAVVRPTRVVTRASPASNDAD